MNGAGADIWGEDDEGDALEQQGMEREWQARREEHYSSGYREGLEAGKHETVQEGFDAGYVQGAAAGYECGMARGAAATLRALAPRLPDLAGRLQHVQQQQDGQQRGELADMPYQQVQQRVCEALMAAGPGVSSSEQAGRRDAGLPPDVAAGVRATHDKLQVLGLQAPSQKHAGDGDSGV